MRPGCVACEVVTPSPWSCAPTTLGPMLRVVLLDDHPAVLAGLRRLIDAETDMGIVGATADASEVHALLDGTAADIVVLDHDLAHADGLAHCLRVKRRSASPAVVVYAAYAGPALRLAASAAGADALVDKADTVPTLLAAIRDAARGTRTLPPVPREAFAAGVERVDDEDLPILAMLLDGARADEIAGSLRRDPGEIAWRAQRIVGRLCPGLRQRPIEESPDGVRVARP
jgi:DNA-binding NarL/FixJ family response regulator